MGKINIVADTHNVPALKKILQNLENVFSLGDIAAVDTKEYFANIKRYSYSWKGYKKNLPDFSKEDRDWFENVNRYGWLEQMQNIKENAKGFTVAMGNSDEYMIKYIPEVENSLIQAQNENESFSFKKEVELIKIDNLQLLFLPFREASFKNDLEKILNRLDESKTLLVLGHCPPYADHKKEYYLMHNEALEFISKNYSQDFYYFHGHIHSDKTYKYKLPNLNKVTIITPKAPDTEYGINWNHDYVEVDTQTGELKVFSLYPKKEGIFEDLPVGYRQKEDHWNDFGKAE